ncbi:tumor necrosis factor receptor superfamily member 27 isoform X9 [Oryctolagus cuniculus]|uniref:tumor necrosis factor receptor superfamily member 27 isoform X9 n=1 Tax=Oryctolagus cuniculus TaxID=9986 RepID=UPI0022311019|nr:tumor necrosis factor receptor superfamily member 27 isoform X6 [Oryctolagus cuniculus]
MSTGTNGDGVLPANSVVLDRSSPRTVVMERGEMHTAQPALPAGIKAAGATTDVRVVSTVLLSIVSRKPTARLPLMLSVGTVCPGFTERHVLEACRTKSASPARSRPPPLRCLPVELSEGRCTHSAPSGGHTCCTGGSVQFEADEAAEEESLFPKPPGQETSTESPVSESIFEIQPLNPILDDDCSSTRGFPTQESFTMASCASESHSHWVHTPIECTELDLQKFSSSASYTGAETLGGNADESSGDRLEPNVPFEVASP